MLRLVPLAGSRALWLNVGAVIGLAIPNIANAQCVDDLNVASTISGQLRPVQDLTPLGTGSSLSALTSVTNTVNTAFLTSSSSYVSSKDGNGNDRLQNGIWGRTVGGTVDVESSSVGTVDVSKVASLPPNYVVEGKQTCNTKVHQNYYGAQFGYDVAKLNLSNDGGNIFAGVTGGYLRATVKDETPAGSYVNPFPFAPFPQPTIFNTPSGDLDTDVSVPFIGLYAAYVRGGFFLDSQVRADFYRLNLDDAQNFVDNLKVKAEGIAFTTNVGYSQPLSNNWFIQPSGGVVVSEVFVDEIDVRTTQPITYGNGPIVVDDILSVLGRVSVKVGTKIASNGVTWQPFLSASVFHEFNGDVSATSTVAGTGNPGTDGLKLTTVSDGGVGTYGQYGIGADVILGNSGWLGYARGDYRKGDDLEGWGFNAGLRHQW